MKTKDHYYYLAKKKGYRSRASFKLMQINERYHIIKRGFYVLDLGSSPGGWSQVALELVGKSGKVVGVDIKPMHIKNVEFIRGNVFDDNIIERIKEKIESFDAVISDMSPKISGIKSMDHARSMELAERTFYIGSNMLKEGGNMVVKVFQGNMLNNFVKKLRNDFEMVKLHKPRASSLKSSEIYVICKRFKFFKTPRNLSSSITTKILFSFLIFIFSFIFLPIYVSLSSSTFL